MRTHTEIKLDEDVKKRIMDEARILFFRYGFSKVTMDEAAEALGMSKKTLYRYFPSKEDLLQEVTSAHMEECDAELKAICHRQDISPLDRLKLTMTYITGLFSQMSEPLVHDLRRNVPDLWKQVEKHRQKNIETDFGALIKEGRQKGQFRKDVDERLFILIYSHVVRDILNPETLSGLPFKPSQVYDTICKVLFEGLLTDKARAEYHAK
ncbi:MAG TPA: TetR/AcrR family transcriptional regulator [Fibrobacteria bacterium]|nr:TetR/AcrR family transcriptional regulator [Fibrobacteria bacterium]